MSHKRLTGRLDGDFSRIRTAAGTDDSAVRLLQGRVILDSDWNLQAEITADRRRRGFADLIGPAGAPAEGAGFGVFAEPSLHFDGESSLVVIGGDGVEVWGGGAGACIELIFEPTPGRGGVLIGRFSRRADEGFGHDLTLALEADGRIGLHVGGDRFEAPMPARWGRRNHLALSWVAGRVRWWVNGHSATVDAELPLRRSPSVAVLGATLRGGEPTQGFAGSVHELRFWDEERSVRQLEETVDPERLDPATPGLGGWWRFDRPGSGLEVPDRGRHGVPAVLGGGHADRAPRRRDHRLHVTAGRFWLEGMLCRRHSPEVLDSPTRDELARGTWLFYLEAFEVLVTVAQDPTLIEPALGGADTSARSRVVSEVKTVQLPQAIDPEDGDAVDRAWRQFANAASRRGTVRARRQGQMVGVELGNLLYRAEVRSGGALGGSPWTGAGESDASWVELLSTSQQCVPGRARLRVETWPSGHGLDAAGAPSTPWRVGDALELSGRGAETGDGAEEVDLLFAAVVGVDAAARELVVESDKIEKFARATGLAIRRLATWVWSRDNGSVLFPVEHVDDDGLSVQLMTTVRQFELNVDDWVEWLATDGAGSPGTLHQVVAIHRDLGTVELEPGVAPAASSPTSTAADAAVLRRWDQQPLEGAPLVGGAVVMLEDQWQSLESGIEVHWSGDGPYVAGDYWWMPARTALSDIEWPRGADGLAERRPPEGIERRRALLAASAMRGDGELSLVDYRRTFQPAIDGAVSKAGDTMYGPLRIESNLEVAGVVSAGELVGRLGSVGAVSAPNLQDGAVTARALAGDVGVVPPGASILGETPEAPLGYQYTGAVHRIDHADLVWCRLAPMPRTDSRCHAASTPGFVWLIYESGEVWAYDVAGSCWQPGPALPAPRRGFSVASLDGVLYLVGGSERGQHALRFDPRVGQWELISPLRHRRSHLGVAALAGQLYAAGGLEGQRASRRLEAYDPVLDRWADARPMPRGRFDLAAASVCGRVYALGGAVKPTLDRFGCRLVSTVEAYHPPSDRWLEHLAHLPSPRSEVAATSGGDRLFAAGGTSIAGPLDAVDGYDPASD
ncbi:MAG: DUF6519 domain-containing protein, partial [Acidobacteriota bacterium]